MEQHEKLEDLGVVPYELLHLLPEPPADSGLQERPPEFPVNRGYAAAGNVAAAIGLVVVGLGPKQLLMLKNNLYHLQMLFY